MTNQQRLNPQVAICPTWPVPVGLQLAEQFKWAIASGTATPGSQLPTVEQVAAAVGLNRNTVNAVYNDLARAGLLEVKRGTGTRVAASPQVAGWQQRAPLVKLLTQCLEEAATLGFSPQEAAFLLLARAAWAEQQERRAARFGFLATPDTDATGYAAALAAVTGRPVETMYLAELREGHQAGREMLQRWQLAAVPASHLLEADRLLSGLRLLPLEWQPAARTVTALTGLPAGAPVAVVATNQAVASLMRDGLQSGGLGHLRIFSGTLGDRPLVAALPHMVHVWTDAPAQAVLGESLPGLTLHTFAWELTPNSEDLLRRTMASDLALSATYEPVAASV